MKQFGYGVHPDRQIDYDKQNRRFIEAILKGEPSLKICIGCGSCTATCTAGQFTDFNIRKLHTLLQRGEIKTIKEEIGKCMFCGKCQLICPRGVNLRNLILTINRVIEQLG
jgi:heterodisulfide reductase subunit C